MSPIADPAGALADVVREVEAHASRSGWDQPAQLFALVETADLVEREPHLAEVLGVEAQAEGLTPVEQETTSESLEELLSTILWPPEVAGCAVVLEAMTVPPDAEHVPDDAEAAAAYAAAIRNAKKPASSPDPCAPGRASARSASAHMTTTTWCWLGRTLYPSF